MTCVAAEFFIQARRGAVLAPMADAPSRVVLVLDDAMDPLVGKVAECAAGTFATASVVVEAIDLAALHHLDRTNEFDAVLADAFMFIGSSLPGSVSALRASIDKLGRTNSETDGWVGRAYGIVLIGGSTSARRAIEDELDDLGLIDASAQDRLDRFVGCEPPCSMDADSLWRSFDIDPAWVEASAVARSIVNTVSGVRAGRLCRPDLLLARPRVELIR